jgi:hypothetical protein
MKKQEIKGKYQKKLNRKSALGFLVFENMLKFILEIVVVNNRGGNKCKTILFEHGQC